MPNIIRNRAKIKAAVMNTAVFKAIQEELGLFNAYISGFCPRESILDHKSTTSGISDAFLADLRKRGMKFVGSTTIHAFLQSIGVFIPTSPHLHITFKRNGRHSPSHSIEYSSILRS